ncbi:hypothetical protein [Sphingopyxis sp. R3-92]|uniref:hypothetical protein n=1 Tax=Sphingopyxis sp. R3-92 TaxID=3158553 RepID=UPI003EE77B9F
MSQLICWLLVGLVHLVPALALFRPALITRLYGVAPDSPLFLLMHHRAALFFAVFIACIWAAFDPGGRKLATLLAAISMLGFLLLYVTYGRPAALGTIALVDLIGLIPLAWAGWRAFQQ